MQKNRRFPLPEPSPPPSPRNMSFRSHSRFSRDERSTNPFKSDNRRRSEERPINPRAKALLGDDSESPRENPFQRQKNNARHGRFEYSDNGSFSRNRQGDGDKFSRNKSRFGRPQHRSYFRKEVVRKPTFALEKEKWPNLDGNTKVPEAKNNVEEAFGFKDAAHRGAKCATPPPGPGLPPTARLSRPPKHESDDESTGWHTEDERLAREEDPSDNEEEEEETFLEEGDDKHNN
jgi:hypothetical protein